MPLTSTTRDCISISSSLWNDSLSPSKCITETWIPKLMLKLCSFGCAGGGAVYISQNWWVFWGGRITKFWIFLLNGYTIFSWDAGCRCQGKTRSTWSRACCVQEFDSQKYKDRFTESNADKKIYGNLLNAYARFYCFWHVLRYRGDALTSQYKLSTNTLKDALRPTLSVNPTCSKWHIII